MASSDAAQPVAEGIYQVRIPLPFALNIVNCYLLHDGDGWTVLDTGLNTPPAREAWQSAFARAGHHARADQAHHSDAYAS